MGNIWSKEQTEKVNQLDADFEIAVKEAGIERNSKDAADFWRSGGFQQRMFDIFKKEDVTYSGGGPIPSDLQAKLADYKKRAANPLLPASAKAKLEEIMANIAMEIIAESKKAPETASIVDISQDIDVQKMATLETRLKLLKKMVSKKPSATLKTRIKIVEKMLNKVAFGDEFMASDDKGTKKIYSDSGADLMATYHETGLYKNGYLVEVLTEKGKALSKAYKKGVSMKKFFVPKALFAGFDKMANSTGNILQINEAVISDNGAFEKLIKIANDNNLDEDDKKKIKKEEVAKLVAAGYTLPQLGTIYFGYKYNHTMPGDNELSSIGGFMSYRDEAIEGQIKSLIENQENNEFELGLKYPDFNWKAIIKKYNIASKPQIIEKEHVYPDGDNDVYIYEIYSGKDVVIGHSIGRKRYKKGKLEETIMNDNELGDVSKQKKSEMKPGFNGGYWGVASSKIEVIDDIAKMLTSQKDSYVKDVDIYVNRLGGVAPDDLKANNVKFEQGGEIGCGCKHALRAANGTKVGSKKDKKINISLDAINGKYVNIYTLGVPEPTAHKIVSAKITPENFEHRNVTLTFVGGGQESIPFKQYTNFLSGKEVTIKDGRGEPYILQLIS